MTDDEFRDWLRDEVDYRRMTPDQMHDLLGQKALFERARGDLQVEYQQRIVGYVADQRRVAAEIHDLLDQAKTTFPGRMIYFEPIGFDLF